MIDERFRIFDHTLCTDPIERNIVLTGIMLFPDSTEQRTDYIYQATIHHLKTLSEEQNGKADEALFTRLQQIIAQNGSFKWLAQREEKATTKPLADLFASRLIRGHIAAYMLKKMMDEGLSISQAAASYLNLREIHSESAYFQSIMQIKPNMSETDLTGNVWREFKSVAHLYAPFLSSKQIIHPPFIDFDEFNTPSDNEKGFHAFACATRDYAHCIVKKQLFGENILWKLATSHPC